MTKPVSIPEEDESPSPPSSITAEDYLQNQLHLENEARELMPYDPNQCTYSMGPLRQEVYACLTCYEKTKRPCGVCFACSINCHSKHRLVELFTKRNFTCDCGTSRTETNGPCRTRYRKSGNTGFLPALVDLKVRKPDNRLSADIACLSNVYNQNYENLFCSCHRPYDPTENTNMFQCQFGQACGEDWYHEECIMGLKPNTIDRRPHPKDGVGRHHLSSKPGQNATSDEKQPVVDVSEAEEEEEDDGEDILPMPGFPNLETFDTIVCWICVSKFKVEFDRLAILLDCQKVYHVKANSIEERETLLNGTRNNSGGAKRTKQDFPYTILLKKDFKKQIKHTVIENKPENRSLIKLLKEFPYMYDSDPIYKPPEDSDDDNSSVFELGLKELSKVPVEQAITGMQAYDKIKSKLTEFLRPFAEQKKIVTEEEVKKFFSKEMADKK